MKKRKSLLERYQDIPRQLKSRHVAERSRAQRLIALTICVPVMLFCAVRIFIWEVDRKITIRNNENYANLYASAEPTEVPFVKPTSVPTVEPTMAPTAAPTVAATAVPTAAPTVEATAFPTAAPTTLPVTASPVPTSTVPEFEVAVDATLVPEVMPNNDTLVYALETPGPIQESFNALLAVNDETVGFLSIDDVLSLPVVQRENDNAYYLDHSFEREQSNAGTLFLDGSNLLVPKDQNLIIYGHNMKNGTMFHALIGYDDLSFLRKHPLVQFDTIYENRTYVPFAVLSVAVDEGNAGYLNIRRFLFDEDEFDGFVRDLRSLSKYSIPVDVSYGDEMLMLVTCEYTRENGRFVIALRAQREGESTDELCQLVSAAKLN